MINVRTIGFLTVGVVLLAACGQKGPLYRPDDRAEAVHEPQDERPAKRKFPPAVPAPQSQKEDRTPEPASPTDPATAPPAVDPDRPAAPPPGT